MLNLPLPVRIYLCTRQVDLRKSFDGLAQLVREFLSVDPLSGHLFVFRNKRGDRLKLLYWDRDGYIIVYKRLEIGVFLFPSGRPHPPGHECGSPSFAI
jgi:transposase